MPRSHMRTAVFAAAASLSWAAGVQAAEQAQSTETNARVYRKAMETHRSQGEVRPVDGSSAVLLTSSEGAFASIETTGLEPGNVHTLWLVVINEPQACATTPCGPPDVLKQSAVTKSDATYGDGIIAGSDGAGRFTGFLPVGDLPNSWFGNGFQNPQGAEIHLVLMDHGPLIPEMAPSMLTSFRGGCADESIPAAFPDTAKSDGEPGPNTCRLVQAVIFTQGAEAVAATEAPSTAPSGQ